MFGRKDRMADGICACACQAYSSQISSLQMCTRLRRTTRTTTRAPPCPCACFANQGASFTKTPEAVVGRSAVPEVALLMSQDHATGRPQEGVLWRFYVDQPGAPSAC